MSFPRPASMFIRLGLLPALALLWMACSGNTVSSGHGGGGTGSDPCCPPGVTGPCPGGGCVSNADCATGAFCDTCTNCQFLVGCTPDAGCPSGATCDGDGLCDTDVACSGNADCPTGSVCLMGSPNTPKCYF